MGALLLILKLATKMNVEWLLYARVYADARGQSGDECREWWRSKQWEWAVIAVDRCRMSYERIISK